VQLETLNGYLSLPNTKLLFYCSTISLSLSYSEFLMVHVGEVGTSLWRAKVKTVGLAPHENCPKAYDYIGSNLVFTSFGTYSR
jgi:hypothetical protein